MRITNKFNLPEPIVEAIRSDPYTKGKADFSITELIDSPRIAALKARHWEEIERDASDMIWPLLGRAIHSLLEVHGKKLGLFTEQRIYTNINGWTISGGIDLQRRAGRRCKITDYKFTSAKVVMMPIKREWEEQLNLYATLLESINGFGNDNPLNYIVEELEIAAIVRDWSKEKIKSSPDYPQAPMLVIPVPLWEGVRRYNLLLERLQFHIDRKISESFKTPLPLCTPEERWMRGEAWALMKGGNTRATKIFYNQEEATKALDEVLKKDRKGDIFYLDYRPAIPLRCMNYCDVAPFCEQWKSEQEILNLKGSSDTDE